MTTFESECEDQRKDLLAAEFVHEDGSHTFIHYQDFVEEDDNPMAHEGGVGVLLCSHGRYDLGTPHSDIDSDIMAAHDHLLIDLAPVKVSSRLGLFERYLRVYHGTTVFLRLGLIDHSGISMYVGGGAHPHDPGGWDSGTVGFAFDTAATREANGDPDRTPESVEECIRSQVKVYDQYLRNEIYSYTHLTPGEEISTTDFTGETAECRYCGHRLELDPDGIYQWADPDATGDDEVWRYTCGDHDTFVAEHEPTRTLKDEDSVYGFLGYDSLREIAEQASTSPIVEEV